ncbi:MAG: dihydroxyacetone kinase subunit L [Sedimentitalea sp.]|uniref:dihydroxyacetone kinase subunit L n=1 Tax=Sedimentitalea sp. TaxID=2048915 RepID=UPI003266475D
MSYSTEDLRSAIDKIQTKIDPIGKEMNELDGRLGDGDLGVTLINGFNNLAKVRDDLPVDFGMALYSAAKAITAVSGSSFGTLMATALMAAGKATKGQETVAIETLPDLLQTAQDAMISRGGANLGDKTMLDVLHAVIKATRASSGSRLGMLDAARAATDETISAFRDKPNKIGRARVYSEKSVGLDDPGMMALKRMLDCLAD